MQTLVLASKNQKKLKELEVLFDLNSVRIVSLNEFEGIVEVEEDGATFEENAAKKALGYARQTGCLTIADDSGLCVDFLGGKPGIFSARYAGADKDDNDNCNKVLQEMKECIGEKRSAYFIAAVAIATPEEVIEVVVGKCSGFIAQESRGQNGFGYDPIFYYSDYKCTFGEIAPERKHAVSHRAKALHKAKQIIETLLS